MKQRLLSVAALSLMAAAAHAGTDTTTEALKSRIDTLEERIELLLEETADLKSGFNYTTVQEGRNVSGLGDAASKVYYSKSPLSVGGYGEMYWANPDNGGAYADVYRFVPYFGYKFSDHIVMNAEVEFEHGGDEVALEFMYVDFLLGPAVNLRLGHLLVPMGLVNMRHEPTLFNTVQRPEVERYLLSSTWHENGAVAYGSIGDSGLEYHIGVVNALDLTAGNGGGATGWIRSGRMGSDKSSMSSVAVVGRLDYTGVTGLLAGVSLYHGDAAQNTPSGSRATLYDLHASYAYGGFALRGLYTAATVDGAEKWGIADAATEASGYYVNLSFDLFSLGSRSERLPLFVQYESYDPIEKTVDGTLYDVGQKTTTVGVNYAPLSQVVLKLDYAMKAYDDPSKADVDTLSFGLGFLF